MAEFQTKVEIEQGKGIAGGTASINPILSAPFNYLAKENVKIGGFVWDNGDGTVSGTTTDTTAAPVGFAHLDRIYTIDVNAGASLEVAAGATVEVVTGGDFYAVAKDAVTAGADVYADTATGDLYGAEGSGYVKTGFKWAESVAAGEVAVITTNRL